MTLAAVSVVPAAPMLLPAASPAQPADVAAGVARLRAAIDAALAALTGAETVVLLTVGDAATVHDADTATLASYGLPEVAGPVTPDADLVARLRSRWGAADGRAAPEIADGRLHGDPAVLCLHLSSVHRRAAVVPVTVPGRAGAAELGRLADELFDTVAASGRTTAVLAAGDLSATRELSSPGYLTDGAIEWDEAAVAAVRAGDPDRLAALGPEDAARVVARGWAPLVVLLRMARRAGLALPTITALAPRGVGQLVAY